MRLSTLAITAVAVFSLNSQAALIGPIHKYIHTSGKVVELQGINQSKGTAYYFDYELGKRIVVSLGDVSKETKSRINGIKAGEFVLAQTEQGQTVCTTYNVFENGMSYLGCRTGKMMEHFGPSRFAVGGYIADTKEIGAEVSEVAGFQKGEKVILTKDAGYMKAGKKVKIKAIFEDGVALVESANPLAALDTSSTLLKTNVEVVQLQDLQEI